MKKAGIITHYNVHNHGAQLQLYGLIATLKKMGYEAKALQFNKNYDFIGGDNAGKKYNISFRSIPLYIDFAIKNGIGRTIYNIRKKQTLSKFRASNQIVGDYYYESTNLDAVIIGSDEIFSIEAGPNPWYYGIGIPCKKQISYAASFGPTTINMIDEYNVAGLIEGGLNHINSISVRDQNSVDIIRHYLNKEVPIVCDPVLLYGYKNELDASKIKEFKSRCKKKYCIVYSYDYNMNDSETVKHIKSYAKRNNFDIYSIGYYHKWCDKNIDVNPLDVFKWFACAEMVFTDTFHGSVISLTCGTQFITKLRGNSNKLDFLLKQYGVLNRKIDSFSEIDNVISRPIDYKRVNERIMAIRKSSLQFLKGSLLHD